MYAMQGTMSVGAFMRSLGSAKAPWLTVDAAAESRRTVAEARKAAEELLEEARRQAGAETRQMLARAEADAAEETKTILAEAEQRCQALKQNARTRLDQAAKRIVEGVVKG